MVHDRTAIDKLPQIGVKATEGALDVQEGASVSDCTFDFETVADNRRLLPQLGQLRVVIGGNTLGIELVKAYSVRMAPFEDS
jgi:hypothetical protein